MNEINFNPDNNINFKQSNKSNSKYANMKASYLGYLDEMKKSDFANSLTRYQIELNLLKDMRDLALEENKPDEIDYIKERYNILSDKFQQFGIVLKNMEEI